MLFMTSLNLHSIPTLIPCELPKNTQIYSSIIGHQNGEGKETLQL